MSIRLIESLHLIVTQKRHFAEIIARGWTEGHSGRFRYSVAPVAGKASRFRYHWRKSERDDWGRPVTREGRGIIECSPGSG